MLMWILTRFFVILLMNVSDSGVLMMGVEGVGESLSKFIGVVELNLCYGTVAGCTQHTRSQRYFIRVGYGWPD